MTERRALTIAAVLFVLLDMTPLRIWGSPIRKDAPGAGHSEDTHPRRN